MVVGATVGATSIVRHVVAWTGTHFNNESTLVYMHVQEVNIPLEMSTRFIHVRIHVHVLRVILQLISMPCRIRSYCHIVAFMTATIDSCDDLQYALLWQATPMYDHP